MEKEFVEIAGIKWAKCNIGAEKETDKGLYFQWGDTQGYSIDEIGRGEDENLFNWESYKYYNGRAITKYIYTDGKTIPQSIDGKTVLEASDDAATANWGNDWRMPTKDEFDALLSATISKWTTVNGVNGRLFTDKTDSSKELFFPACGRCYNGDIHNVGRIGDYWSSSINRDCVQFAYYLNFYNDSVYWMYSSRRCGFPVRAVMK